ncbi:phage terminase large subunit [Bradyrhizobium genosp. L]|uniref:phage terminase large subunit n=1 Tax=Bradyrhizobium genosp. L TaxID=83637 RepID=UPI001FEE3E53|nr:phage terminase large subunit [Bradyrhizobium genosp. L]
MRAEIQRRTALQQREAERIRLSRDSISQPTAVRAQAGPQERFLASTADICIYGGSAGGGKSYGLLLEALRHIDNAAFGAVIFRKTLVDVKKQGSLLDTSIPLYGQFGASLRQAGDMLWRFPSGAKVAFGHLEHEKTVLDWQGAQIPLICFDELTHFSRTQFFYMLSRNRSTCGVRPYVRATCNPDADSWVAEFISWWIDQETGLPIPERSGVIRYFVRVSDSLVWGDTDRELRERFPGAEPKSVTFIPSRLEDNAILMARDPGYRANLMALNVVDRERLLGGNWKIRPAAGLLFKRGWCEVVDAVPNGAKFVRGWDLAATPKTESNDPDRTCGTKIGRMPDGRFIVAHHVRMWGAPLEVERLLKNTASDDGLHTLIALPQDPGQAGKAQKSHLAQVLVGYRVKFAPATGDKVTRFGAFSAQAAAGNVVVLRGPWNEDWFAALEAFGPEARHDDDADATSEAFNELIGKRSIVISEEALAASRRPSVSAHQHRSIR